MSARHNTLVLGLLAALIQTTVFAQEDPVKVLIEQGQYWQSRGNGVRATEAWQKLLRLNPTQPDALYGMAQIELDGGRTDGARSYLAQLKRSSPNSPLVARLEQNINLGSNSAQLQQARQLARSGQASEAISTYQSALGGKAPDGPLALEYYQTLGAMPQGWDEARQGLERLAKASPNDQQIALALAQHLTYRESTRREGISQLSRLASRADVGKAATDSWRKALAWIGTRQSDAPLYQAYLDANPGDTGVKARLDEIARQQQESRQAPVVTSDPLRQRTTEGFKELDGGDMDKAAADFQAVLTSRPNDGDALGGLGLIRLRQENFPEAKDLLQRASRQGSSARWKSALDSANYWTLVNQANTAKAAGNTDAARQALEQAVKIDPNEATGQNALGDLLASTGQLDAAEATYRHVLDRQADNPDAIRGLVGVMSQNNKPDQALSLIERLTPQQQDQIGELGRLRAAQAVGVAKAAAQRGDDAGARVHLEEALLNDPTSPWIRLDLARLYMKMGAYNDARGVMDGLLVSNPNLPEGLYASALLATEMKDWRGALDKLDAIPPQSRTRDIAGLQRRAWVHAQADSASALAKQGRNQEAIAMLTQVESFAGQDPELLGAVAMAYTDAGDSNRALNMIRQLMARTTRPEVGIRLQYAAILLKTGQDVELSGILRQIQPMQMTKDDRKSFDDLRQAYIIRQVDALRQSGDLVTAYDTLAPLLSERPNDPQVVGALARMYSDAGDYSQALGLYNVLLKQDPNNLETLLAAASMATSAKEYRYAESAVNSALAQAPQNADVLTTAGRLYRAQGKTSKAEQYFSAAVAIDNRQQGLPAYAAGPGQVVAAGPARSANPFVGRPGQRAASAPAPQVPTGYNGGAQAYPLAQPSPAAAQMRSYFVQPPEQPQMVAQAYIPAPAGANMFPPPANNDYAQAAAQQQQQQPQQQQQQQQPPQGYSPYGQPPPMPMPPAVPPNPAMYYQPAYAQPAYGQPQAQQQSLPQPAAQAPRTAQAARQPAASNTVPRAAAARTPARTSTRTAANNTSNRVVYTPPPATQTAPPAGNYTAGSYIPAPVQQAYAQPPYPQQQYAQPYPAQQYQQPQYQQQPYPQPQYQQYQQQPYQQPQYQQPQYQPPQQAQYQQPQYQQPQYPQQPYQQQYQQPQYPPQPAYQQPQYAAPQAQSGTVPGYGYGQPQPAPAVASGPQFPGQVSSGPRTARDDLAEIQQTRSSVLSVGGTVRTRQGEPGLGQLTDLEAPVEFRFPAGDGKLAVRATPVTLDAGTPGSGYDANSRFGGGPAAALQQVANGTRGAGSQTQSGVGVGLAYEIGNIQADVGTSPLGFQYTDLNGGVKVKGPINDMFNYSAEFSRRAVTDSLLSFAGARDDRTGQEWGGVSSTGGRLELGWDNGQYGMYGYGAYHALTGTNVASNTGIEGGAGLYWRLVKAADTDLTAGVNFTGLSYDKNLRYFTYGQGGYFSPQQFLAVSVPVSWNQRSGRLSYQLRGSVGVQSFREDSSPYFPTSSSLQSAAQQAATDASAFGLTSATGSAVYPGQSKTGLGYNLNAAVEYQVAPQLFLGGHLAMDNASDYRQLVGGVYLRYAMQPYTGQPAMPVAPYKSPYGTN